MAFIGMRRSIEAIPVLLVLTALCLAIAGCHAESDVQDETDDVNQVIVSSDKGVDPSQDSDNAAMEGKMAAAEDVITPLVQGYGDQVAVTVVSVEEGSGFDINGSRSFTSASMIKLLILLEYMEQVDSGALSADEEYVLTESDIVGGTSHINEQGAGAIFTYDQIAESMIAYSDNTAANILINKLGMDAINSRAKDMGLEETDIQRLMMDLESGLENHMSTNDAAKILLSIVNDDAATPQMCDRAEQFLMEQTDNSALSIGLPAGVGFGHKTGSLNENRHDGGIVYADTPYIIVVFTELGSAEGDQLMGQISSQIYEVLES